MKKGDKVIMLSDYYDMKEGDEATCIRLDCDNVHKFEYKSGHTLYIPSDLYILKPIEQMSNLKEELEKASKEMKATVLKSFKEFEMKTGLAIECIDIERNKNKITEIQIVIDTSDLW